MVRIRRSHRRGRGSIPRLGSNFLVMKNTDVIPAGQIPHIDDYPMHVCDQSMESALRGQQLLLAYEQNYQVTPWEVSITTCPYMYTSFARWIDFPCKYQ